MELFVDLYVDAYLWICLEREVFIALCVYGSVYWRLIVKLCISVLLWKCLLKVNCGIIFGSVYWNYGNIYWNLIIYLWKHLLKLNYPTVY